MIKTIAMQNLFLRSSRRGQIDHLWLAIGNGLNHLSYRKQALGNLPPRVFGMRRRKLCVESTANLKRRVNERWFNPRKPSHRAHRR